MTTPTERMELVNDSNPSGGILHTKNHGMLKYFPHTVGGRYPHGYWMQSGPRQGPSTGPLPNKVAENPYRRFHEHHVWAEYSPDINITLWERMQLLNPLHKHKKYGYPEAMRKLCVALHTNYMPHDKNDRDPGGAAAALTELFEKHSEEKLSHLDIIRHFKHLYPKAILDEDSDEEILYELLNADKWFSNQHCGKFATDYPEDHPDRDIPSSDESGGSDDEEKHN